MGITRAVTFAILIPLLRFVALFLVALVVIRAVAQILNVLKDGFQEGVDHAVRARGDPASLLPA